MLLMDTVDVSEIHNKNEESNIVNDNKFEIKYESINIENE